MTYQPQVGDRVRVTYEGIVNSVHGGGKRFVCEGAFGADLADPNVTVEKLQDPEPKWVDGDVIKTGHWVPAHRIDGKWINPYGGGVHWFSEGGECVIPEAWRDGVLEILYKADAA